MASAHPAVGLPAWRAALAGTSRDTRDTLFMLAVIGWTILPHLLRLAPWVAVLCTSVLAWRARLAWRQAALPGRGWLVLTLAVAVGLTLLTERTLFGRQAGVTLLVVLMALKTLELRARRDALVVFFLGFFLVLTQFLYSQSALTAVAMGLSVWGWLTALTLAHMPTGRPALRTAAAVAGRAALLGTPIMVALFLLFPRIGPLWAMPGAGARTGLSDTLQLGDVAQLANDDSIALRLRFTGRPPAAEALYFRGPVLSEYDGVRWRVDPFAPLRAGSGPSPAESQAPRYAYDMVLEPLRVPWLPLLDGTRALPASSSPLALLPGQPDAEGQWRLARPLGERVQVSAQADLQPPATAALRPAERRALVALPAGRHPRLQAWARTVQARLGASADSGARVAALLAYIRRQPFVYTLAPGSYGDDPVDEFWFDRRAGFCEHYASAVAIGLRAMGVPARIVTGYQGTDQLAVDGWYAVRQSHAHAWVEYWDDARGWARADPTAAVAPERILRSEALEPPPGLFGGAMEAVTPGLRQQLRRWAEGLDQRWSQWVLGYGKREQFQLLGRLGVESPDPATVARVLVGLLAAAGLAGAVWAWLDGRRRSPWQRLRSRIARRLAVHGVPLAPSDSLRTLAGRLQARHGGVAQAAADALLALEGHRYGRSAQEGLPAGWWAGFDAALSRVPRDNRAR
ncbi:transglutaminaseTgpA domain-containing protein [Ideonella sp.]|uniref:transglutaminaseTgpA domain-containing protein n=1 Tax=Ideonella sp. TaxID=1929293 RepID=UPI0035B35D9E